MDSEIAGWLLVHIRLADYKVLGGKVARLGIAEGIVIILIVLIYEIPAIWIVTDYLPVLAGRDERYGTTKFCTNEK